MIGEDMYGLANSKAVSNTFGFSSGYCSEAMTLFSKMNSAGGNITEARKLMIDNVIKHLIEENIWQKLDVLYMWVSHSQGASLIDWKNPNLRTAIPSTSGMTFTIDGGWTGSATGSIKLNYNPGDGTKYNLKLNSGNFGIYIGAHVNEGKTDLSGLSSLSRGNELSTINTTFALNSRSNVITAQGIGGILSARGLYSCKRDKTRNWFSEKGGYDIYGTTVKEVTTSEQVPDVKWMEFCRNTNGILSANSTKKHYYFYSGSGEINTFTLNRIIEQYFLAPLGLIPLKRLIFLGNSFISRGYMSAQTVTDLGSYDNYEYYNAGYNGYNLTQLNTILTSSILCNKQKSYLTNDVILVQELTNDFVNTSSNVTTTYNNLITLLKNLRSFYPKAKLVVSTMLPRAETASMVNANRQNDANLTDDTTLNGKIRNHLVADGYADGIADIASDSIMGIYSNGVPGVGEKNTTYFDVDEIHPNNGTGFPYLATNYITPSVSTFL